MKEEKYYCDLCGKEYEHYKLRKIWTALKTSNIDRVDEDVREMTNTLIDICPECIEKILPTFLKLCKELKTDDDFIKTLEKNYKSILNISSL